MLQYTFTPSDLHDLFAFLESEPSIQSTSSSETMTTHRGAAAYSVEERKLRRMMSNRESARRSRWRKKTHLQNLTGDVNRLKVENRELKNGLSLVLHDCHVVQRESNRLMTESIHLQRRLAGLRQILPPHTPL